jgi:hypothetical protein
MTTKDFSQLFPEILNPEATLSNLKALSRSKKYPEDEFASCLHEFCLVRNNYPGYSENPGGYLYSTILNGINKYFRGVKNDFSDIVNLSDTVEMDDHDKKSLKEKLDDFSRGIHKLSLPPNQVRLIEEMIIICENDHKTHKDFMKEVREAQANHGVTDTNFRKLLERLKNNLRGNDDLKDMLSFIPKDVQNINELIEFLLSYIPMETNKLDAYRFSSEEMKKMLWLKDLFEDNGFTVERFPEVYYDTFEKACEVWPFLKEKPNNEDLLDTPDYLGMYIYNRGYSIKDPSEEGIIILFSDRIRDFVSRKPGLTENCVRYVVLMHELGHWLSHWPCGNDLRWLYGFQLRNKRTKEALANIIAYWCLDTDCHKNTMDILTPKLRTPDGFLESIDKDSHNVNTENPYGAYFLLLRKSQKEILEKIKLLRAAFYLEDDKMMDFLQSEIQTLSDFLADGVFEDYIQEDRLEELKKSPKLFSRAAENSIGTIFRDRSGINAVLKGTNMLERFGTFNHLKSIENDCQQFNDNLITNNMSIHTKYLTGRNSIIYIGLNATSEAVSVGSVFCTRVSFWKILKEAGLITGFSKNNSGNYPFEHMANDVFITGELSKICDGQGFTDIVDDDTIISKKSSDVKVLHKHLTSLFQRLMKANPDKIVLLGKRVADEFMRLDLALKSTWDAKKTLNDNIVYDYLGDTMIFGKEVKVYVMPFPETSPIKDKHEHYKRIL